MIQNQNITDVSWDRIPFLFEQDHFEQMQKTLNNIRFQKDPYWDNWLKQRNKCILALLYYMGLRPKEVCNLKFTDFNSKDCTFLIRGENNHSGKDRKLPIPDKTLPFIESYLSLGKRSDWVFPSFKNMNTPLSPSRWKTIMREYILKSSKLWISSEKGTIPRTRSYSLRASFAVRLLENSKNPFQVQYALGHSDFRSLKHYIRLAQINKKSNMDELRNNMY